MGGGESEIDEGTTDCLLESAFFEPAGIFRTSSALDLRSEASARFERGTDPNGTMYAADRAAELMCSLAGGSVAGPAVDVYPSPIKPVEIPFETGKTRDLLGADIDDEQMISILSSLDICVENVKPGYFEAIAPTFRPDLRRSIDLTEEVARVFGFANVPSTIPDSKASATPLSPIQQTARDTRNILVAAGLMECVSYAFIDSADVASLMLPETDERKKLVKIKNPLSENQSVMRPSLLPGLFRAIRFNAGYGQSNGALFELGRVFAPRGTDKPAELTMAACALSGARNGDEWYDKENPYDFYDIKGIVETLIDRLRLGQASIEPSDDPLYHPGQRACLLIKGKPAGMFGMLHPYAADAFELTGSVFAGEFDTGILAESRMGLSKITPPSRYPAVIRDIAVLVDTGINASDIEKIILGAAGDLLNHVRPFDLYQGEKIKDGKKSLAYRLEYRSDERTLTVEEVDAAHAKIFEALRAALKAEIR
jgi:phenylalanyl-tRNA synthetase beta chain